VAEFVRRVAGLAGDAVQREVLVAAAARYEELGGADPVGGADAGFGFGAGGGSGGVRDLAGEPVFRRWMAGRLRGGGAVGERAGQALALMGYRWDGSENPVIRVSTDGVAADLPENEQRVLDHLLDRGGPATHGGIVDAVKGAVKWRGALTRLAMYGLVRRSEPSPGRFVYEAVPPPVDGLVHAEGATARERILELFSGNPGRGFTRDEVRDALPGIISSTFSSIWTALVDSGVLKLDGARYRLASEEEGPGAGGERGKRQQRQGEGDARKRRRLPGPVSPAEGPVVPAGGQTAAPAPALALRPAPGPTPPAPTVPVPVGRVVSGLLGVESGVSAGRAVALAGLGAVLAGEVLAEALEEGGGESTASVGGRGLRVRGYFVMGVEGNGEFEASVIEAFRQGMQDWLLAAGVSAGPAEETVHTALLTRVEFDPVAVALGDPRAGSFVAWLGGAEPPAPGVVAPAEV
ncbi:hypothetical protein ACFXPA_49185, partial [Amycolatopsis sp. NPDC059090]